MCGTTWIRRILCPLAPNLSATFSLMPSWAQFKTLVSPFISSRQPKDSRCPSPIPCSSNNLLDKTRCISRLQIFITISKLTRLVLWTLLVQMKLNLRMPWKSLWRPSMLRTERLLAVAREAWSAQFWIEVELVNSNSSNNNQISRHFRVREYR